MRNDRYLVGMLIGIGLLVITALLVFFIRQQNTGYSPEDTPEGVLHNYILAIEEGDYQRAYTYLAEHQYKPNYDLFRKTFTSQQLDPSFTAVQIGDVSLSGDNEQALEAVIDLNLIQSSQGPFGDVYHNTGKAYLEMDASGEWKISNIPYPYWNWDWYTSSIQNPQKVAP